MIQKLRNISYEMRLKECGLTKKSNQNDTKTQEY